MVLIWLKFALCVLIIFFSGRAVARYGDIIAHKTGLGGMWVGVVLLAVVTSLPELFTGISAITIVGSPDLTVGDLFGANSFNLFNLALLDIVFRRGILSRVTTVGHRLTGWRKSDCSAIASGCFVWCSIPCVWQAIGSPFQM